MSVIGWRIKISFLHYIKQYMQPPYIPIIDLEKKQEKMFKSSDMSCNPQGGSHQILVFQNSGCTFVPLYLCLIKNAVEIHDISSYLKLWSDLRISCFWTIVENRKKTNTFGKRRNLSQYLSDAFLKGNVGNLIKGYQCELDMCSS